MNILKFWQRLNIEHIEPISTGFINQTYKVSSGKDLYVLQKIHPVFKPEVNLDIEAVTAFLESQGFPTPRLLATDKGDLWAMEGRDCWRLMTHLEGYTFEQLQDSQQAFSAGNLVGRFHQTLFQFDYTYRFTRSNVHDTPQYIQRLEKHLSTHEKHVYFKQVSSIAKPLIQVAKAIPNLWKLPARNSHGDLKISNLLFNNTGEAYCVLDLDTLGKMPWALEMGDAFRSWCNTRGENQTQSVFNLELYEAALSGYQSQVWDLWSQPERDSLLYGIKLLPLELCSRFLIDIFEDHYWKWDTQKFESRAEHNWIRALSQWTLYEDIVRKL